jgi:formyltetrahydrofolate hydrolase
VLVLVRLIYLYTYPHKYKLYKYHKLLSVELVTRVEKRMVKLHHPNLLPQDHYLA